VPLTHFRRRSRDEMRRRGESGQNPLDPHMALFPLLPTTSWAMWSCWMALFGCQQAYQDGHFGWFRDGTGVLPSCSIPLPSQDPSISTHISPSLEKQKRQHTRAMWLCVYTKYLGAFCGWDPPLVGIRIFCLVTVSPPGATFGTGAADHPWCNSYQEYCYFSHSGTIWKCPQSGNGSEMLIRGCHCGPQEYYQMGHFYANQKGKTKCLVRWSIKSHSWMILVMKSIKIMPVLAIHSFL